ncbi:MAG: hypothetical protein CMJ19_23835 [Phycisphaeraceae bacterium]|nr:hypothetical protein [Phycisphaeraceae bacterium]
MNHIITGLIIGLFGICMSMFGTSAMASDEQPVWELNSQTFSACQVIGQVQCVDGLVKLDGTNAVVLPTHLTAGQNDFTIEFELKRGDDFKVLPRLQGGLEIVSNMDTDAMAGFVMRYKPDKWNPGGGQSNTFWLYTNGIRNGNVGGLMGKDKFTKYSLVFKNQALTIFRNGLILSAAGDVKPSPLPLTFGEVIKPGGDDYPEKYVTLTKLPSPYQLRKIKVYPQAIFPTGFDQSTHVMENISGPDYMMQCARRTDASLPRILVIGDSQSMGYRSYITEHFKGKAYVDYWVGGTWFAPIDIEDENCKPKRAFRGVLNNGPYDIVTWNAMTGHMWSIKHPTRCPVQTIEPNFTEMVSFLKSYAPQTQFIWVNCTPRRSLEEDGTHSVDNEGNRVAVRNNKIVDKLMADMGIPVVDLYSTSLPFVSQVKRGWTDTVHWSRDVYKVFADELITEIEKHMPKSEK